MLDYFALFLVFFVAVFLFYGIIVLHDIPYEIACKRNHPHRDAIHVAGWVSLFTLHVIWPFLWIWATLYDPEQGWQGRGQTRNLQPENEQTKALAQQLAALQEEVAILKNRLKSFDSGAEEG